MEIFSKLISPSQILNKSVLKKHQLWTNGSAVNHIYMVIFLKSDFILWKTFKSSAFGKTWAQIIVLIFP